VVVFLGNLLPFPGFFWGLVEPYGMGPIANRNLVPFQPVGPLADFSSFFVVAAF